MPAFNLGGFAEGISPAVQQFIQQQQANQAAAGLMNYLAQQQGDQSMQAPPSPGGDIQAAPPVSLPSTDQIASTFGGMPGATQMPGPIPTQAAPSLMPSVMPTTNVTPGVSAPVNPTPPGAGGAGAPPVAAPPVAAGGASPIAAAAQGALGPMSSPMPGGPTSPGQMPGVGAGMAATDPSTGTGQQQDPYKRVQQSTAQLLLGLRKANPRAQPAQIMEMAGKYLELMKGMDTSDKELMREQLSILRDQHNFELRVRGQDITAEDVDKKIAAKDRETQALIADRDRIEQSKEKARMDGLQLSLQVKQSEGAANRANRLQVAAGQQGVGMARVNAGMAETLIRAKVSEYDTEVRTHTELTKDQQDNMVREYDAELHRQTSIYASAFGQQAPAAVKTTPQRPTLTGGGPAPERPNLGGGGPPKPLSNTALQQWKQVPLAQRPAAKAHLQQQGFDVSPLQ